LGASTAIHGPELLNFDLDADSDPDFDFNASSFLLSTVHCIQCSFS
jgi:hypothetical protein